MEGASAPDLRGARNPWRYGDRVLKAMSVGARSMEGSKDSVWLELGW